MYEETSIFKWETSFKYHNLLENSLHFLEVEGENRKWKNNNVRCEGWLAIHVTVKLITYLCFVREFRHDNYENGHQEILTANNFAHFPRGVTQPTNDAHMARAKWNFFNKLDVFPFLLPARLVCIIESHIIPYMFWYLRTASDFLHRFLQINLSACHMYFFRFIYFFLCFPYHLHTKSQKNPKTKSNHNKKIRTERREVIWI